MLLDPWWAWACAPSAPTPVGEVGSASNAGFASHAAMPTPMAMASAKPGVAVVRVHFMMSSLGPAATRRVRASVTPVPSSFRIPELSAC
jgi:hypothetical protein